VRNFLYVIEREVRRGRQLEGITMAKRQGADKGDKLGSTTIV